MTMYADDTSFCHQSHDLTQLNEAINSDLIKLESWLRGNKLSLNVAKTHSMLISTNQKHNSLKRQSEALELKIRDKELEVVQKDKVPWSADRLLFRMERANQSSFCQSLQGDRLFEIC